MSSSKSSLSSGDKRGKSEAGKGDANTRVKDWKRYWKNFDKIKKK